MVIKCDFVYRFSYPSASPIKSNSDGKCREFTYASEKSKPLVVILFGWGGCKDKHLEKYSSIYEERGCITVRVTGTTPLLAFRLDKLQKLAKRFLDLMYEKSLDEHLIIFHVFSNSAALVYQLVSLEMQKRNKTLPIIGMIFDSALHHIRFHPIYCAASNLIGGSVCLKAPVSFVIAAMTTTYFKLWSVTNAAIKLRKPENVDIILAEEPYTWPQLLIYSKSDEVNPWEDVEKFAKRRQERGVKVTKLTFEDSPHVQHLVTHREIYIDTVVDFVQSCLTPYSTHL